MATHSRDAIIQQFCRSTKEHLGIDIRPVQIEAAEILQDATVAEMATGEGKTLAIALAASIHAKTRTGMKGAGIHIATANSYLAARDAEWMRPIYADLQLTVTHTNSVTSTDTNERNKIYSHDIVYGTIRDFGFDFLRSGMESRQQHARSNPMKTEILIVDEADSVLIDESRTPLVITQAIRHPDNAETACFHWAATTSKSFTESLDFVQSNPSGAIALTDEGHRKIVRSEMPEAMCALSTTEIIHAAERAIWVSQNMIRDQHYIVRDEEVSVVDEYTGRSSIERSFGGGVHQAIQAREQLPITAMTQPVARITIQDFVAKFKHCCGITATASEVREELAQVYGTSVQVLRPHKASQLRILTPTIANTAKQRQSQIAEETLECIKNGRAVLIGTRNIHQSESLSKTLTEHQIQHVVLNAKHPEQEAITVAQAGQPQAVTVSTNMAGRGTDIPLHEDVRAAGGLHVIVAQPNESSRIDRQLIGRAGRQGDPGTARIFATPDDDIFCAGLRPSQLKRLKRLGASDNSNALTKYISAAQSAISRSHREQRAILMAAESRICDQMQTIGLDPHLDPLPDR